MKKQIEVAKQIRAIAKNLKIIVSVKSKVFAGGNSVEVQIKSGDTKSKNWFKKIVMQFASNRGKFDPVDDKSILDIREDIPQVNFVRIWEVA